ncbi:MAG: hypothetical protein GDA54_05055 [Alphaproteobacteria bacterium GM7ARS4]|nr:hypothetical protein [Alphaproteobacteria bacterium GM7ARS4]
MTKVIGAILAVSMAVSGCSVYMAAVGSDEKNVAFLRKGVEREAVEFHLGNPRRVNQNSDGTTTHIFEYEIGNEPSLGRAAGHAAMDVLTFGLWEIVGTPIEAVAGETVRLSVTYDENDKVKSYRTTQ